MITDWFVIIISCWPRYFNITRWWAVQNSTSTWLLRKQPVASREAEMALDPPCLNLPLPTWESFCPGVFDLCHDIFFVNLHCPQTIVEGGGSLLFQKKLDCQALYYFLHCHYDLIIDISISSKILESLLLKAYCSIIYIDQDFLYQFVHFFVKINQLWPIDYVWFETIKESQAPDTYLAWEHENVCKTEMTWRLLMGLWTQKTFIHHNDRFCIDASFLQINGMCKYSKNFGAMIWCSKGTSHFEYYFNHKNNLSHTNKNLWSSGP